MGLPEINIIFKTQAQATAKVVSRGVIAAIIKDSGVETGAFTCYSEKDIPGTLTAENQSYLKSILIGNVTAPRKLICYALPTEAADYTAAKAHLETLNWDYVVGAPDITAEQAEDLLTWVGTQRTDYRRKYKCILPEKAADKVYSINVDTNINGGSKGAFCGRLAGIICGTPLTQSITYVKIPEAESCPKLSVKELDKAIDAGKIVLVNDGEKIKIGRGVNSLTTLDGAYNSEKWKSIKVVETVDIIKDDLKLLFEDNYIGKYDARLNHKMLLVSAVLSYLEEMDMQQIIGDTYSCEIDIDAIRQYLIEKKQYKDGMTDAQLLEADTGKWVFLKARVMIHDAIEDIRLAFEM